MREAVPGDEPTILRFIRELAEFEREPDAVNLTEAGLTAALFGEAPVAYAHMAEVDGQPVGLALWFITFSTWVGRPGIYVEELYVTPEARRLGIGRRLLHHLATECVQRGYGRLELSVLDWNESALAFYRSVGMFGMTEWTVQRLTGPALQEFASQRL